MTVGRLKKHSWLLMAYLSDQYTDRSTCAAKSKSHKALPCNRALFEQLFQARIYITDDISTDLILPLGTSPITVESDRAVIHHDASDAPLMIFVPSDSRFRRACYRSQLPELLTEILHVGKAASFKVSIIITSSFEDLPEVLIELNMPSVDWIELSIIIIPHAVDDERLITSESTSDRTTIPQPQYPDFMEQVVRTAQRAGYRYNSAQPNASGTPLRSPRNVRSLKCLLSSTSQVL
ncbi:hypothetical protein BDU57DRAFT_527097 [Ampelomyces quisqualis]|uniref:Uncharacterized protein n=1 Tax=Ampelomyces quisqualis TaxID=50730 RepID=A0A6A5QUB7_AMPQU|nr:hypothetical protein BDU57DRAFT_527097 [Ampelomyces quisqualis]